MAARNLPVVCLSCRAKGDLVFAQAEGVNVYQISPPEGWLLVPEDKPPEPGPAVPSYYVVCPTCQKRFFPTPVEISNPNPSKTVHVR